MAEPSFTIDEWCRLRKVSRSKFYQLKEKGQTPRLHYVGSKPLISPQADADWLSDREAEAA